jgi:c-di-GMP-binding flagellar brake protein YcgR
MKACWALGGVILALSLGLIASAGDDGRKRKSDFETFFKKLDSNMDGKLTKPEFLKMADRAKEKEQARLKLGLEYDKLDPEKKGITKDVFRRFLENGKNSKQPPNPSK